MLFKHITFDGKEKNSNVMKNRSESFYSLRPKIIERFLESWKKNQVWNIISQKRMEGLATNLAVFQFFIVTTMMRNLIQVRSFNFEILSVKIGEFPTFWKPFNNFGTEGVCGNFFKNISKHLLELFTFSLWKAFFVVINIF